MDKLSTAEQVFLWITRGEIGPLGCCNRPYDRLYLGHNRIEIRLGSRYGTVRLHGGTFQVGALAEHLFGPSGPRVMSSCPMFHVKPAAEQMFCRCSTKGRPEHLFGPPLPRAPLCYLPVYIGIMTAAQPSSGNARPIGADLLGGSPLMPSARTLNGWNFPIAAASAR